MSEKILHKILMTADPVGGVWTYVLELCRGLASADIQITLATMGAPLTRRQRDAVEQIGTVSLHESSFKLEWMPEPWNDVEQAAQWLLGLESRVKPDLIHLNGFCHGDLGWKAPRLIVGHSCVFSWFQAVHGVPPAREWRHYAERVTAGLRGADRVTAPSRFMLSALQKNYGPFAASEPIYNGRSASDFPPSGKQPVILTVGRLWDQAKNTAALQASAAVLPWPIYAAGPSAEAETNSFHLDKLKGLGALDSESLKAWFGRASIFVSPALYEPFGLAALEAALAGCALVLGAIPSLREIWQDAAVFVDPRDPPAIADALRRLVDDALLRRQMAQRARRRALYFTPQRMVGAYLELYEELVTGAGGKLLRQSERTCAHV